MFGIFKINTALFICAAFIFKFLFLNANAITSIAAHQHSKSRFSNTPKRNRDCEVADHSTATNYAAFEICEESPDEKEHFMLNIFLPLLVLYTLVAGKLNEVVQKIIPSPAHFSYTSSQRYLLLQTFRI